MRSLGRIGRSGGTSAENRIRNSPALAAPPAPGSLGDMVAGRATSSVLRVPGLPAYFQIPATFAGGKGRPRLKIRRRSAGRLTDSGSAGGIAFCRVFEESGNQDLAAAAAGLRPFGTAVFDVAVGLVPGGAVQLNRGAGNRGRGQSYQGRGLMRLSAHGLVGVGLTGGSAISPETVRGIRKSDFGIPVETVYGGVRHRGAAFTRSS